MIVETAEEFQIVKDAVASGDSFWIPMYSDVFRHYMHNDISFLYIYSISEDRDFIISFRHMDCISHQRERIHELVSDHDIFVLAKKRFCYFYPYSCIDADMVAWWQTHKMLPLDDTNTAAHEAWNRWWYNETNTNDWLPITRHIERCVSMRDKFMESYRSFTKTDAFEQYEHLSVDNFYAIETSGIAVDRAVFDKKLKSDALQGHRAFTEYNLYTVTGRPSNKFGGVNYAALNKEDGSRAAFVSRFRRGIMLEMDFDAYHVRLIADMIDYQLPAGSVHEYFGKQYFGKDQLTDQEYEESKQITFRLLYGGIDDDFAKIPFFNKVRTFIGSTWHEFKKSGVIHTPLLQRPMFKDSLPDMNPNKLFNYILQATETERNIQVISNVIEYLQDFKSMLVLYTYDSLLFDFDLDDGGGTVDELIDIISESGKFPVKIKAGSNYDSMKTMNR